MVAAGDIVRASDPFRRLGTDKQTTASGSFTTVETSIGSLTVDLISGATYAVVADAQVISSVVGDRIDLRIREDTTAGNTLQQVRTTTQTATTAVVHLYSEFTASSTASKTFVLTAIRQNGTGNITRNAASTAPQYFYCDRIS